MGLPRTKAALAAPACQILSRNRRSPFRRGQALESLRSARVLPATAAGAQPGNRGLAVHLVEDITGSIAFARFVLLPRCLMLVADLDVVVADPRRRFRRRQKLQRAHSCRQCRTTKSHRRTWGTGTTEARTDIARTGSSRQIPLRIPSIPNNLLAALFRPLVWLMRLPRRWSENGCSNMSGGGSRSESPSQAPWMATRRMASVTSAGFGWHRTREQSCGVANSQLLGLL